MNVLFFLCVVIYLNNLLVSAGSQKRWRDETSRLFQAQLGFAH